MKSGNSYSYLSYSWNKRFSAKIEKNLPIYYNEMAAK